MYVYVCKIIYIHIYIYIHMYIIHYISQSVCLHISVWTFFVDFGSTKNQPDKSACPGRVSVATKWTSRALAFPCGRSVGSTTLICLSKFFTAAAGSTPRLMIDLTCMIGLSFWLSLWLIAVSFHIATTSWATPLYSTSPIVLPSLIPIGYSLLAIPYCYQLPLLPRGRGGAPAEGPGGEGGGGFPETFSFINN